ncbi:MAG: hypothetical protein AAF242_21200, partial [Bacteroidota bacterium]
MQDNPFDDKFMDQAWGQMKTTLDQEMPERRKRRMLLWWWLFPVLLVGLSISGYAWKQGLFTQEKDQEPIDTPIAAKENSNLNSEASEQRVISNTHIQDVVSIADAPQIGAKSSNSTDLTSNISTQNSSTIPQAPQPPSSQNNSIDQPTTSELTDIETPHSQTLKPLTSAKALGEGGQTPNNPMSQQESDLEHTLPKPLLPTLSTLSSKQVFLNYENPVEPSWPIQIRKQNRSQLWINGFLASPLNTSSQRSLGLGVAYAYPVKRWQVSIGLNLVQGKGLIERAGQNNNDDLFSNAEEANPSGSFADPQTEYNTDLGNSVPTNFNFYAANIGTRLEYRWALKWSSMVFLEFGQLFNISAQNTITENQFADLSTNRSGIPAVEMPSQLDDLFESKTFLDW